MPATCDAAPDFLADTEYPGVLAELRAAFTEGKLRSYEARDAQLRRLLTMLKDNQEAILKAVIADLKAPDDALLELKYLVSQTCYAIQNLKSWMKPTYVAKTLPFKLDDCHVQSEPLGTVLIIGAWNYPLNCILEPLLGALAAGNTAVIKPSELASNTARLLGSLVPQYLDVALVRLINADAKGTAALLDLKWDHVFYTGSARVGRLVYQAAARHLTPVTLELGGKSPCLVADDSDIEVAAKRIAWGKFCNAGQVCIAPDYVCCTEAVFEPLLAGLRKAVEAMFGPCVNVSETYGKIINGAHFARLADLAAAAKDCMLPLSSEASKPDVEARILPPMAFKLRASERGSSVLMQEELFGPLLPILIVDSMAEAVQLVRARDKPLALYLFSNDKALIAQVKDGTSSGGLCINDTFMHSTLNTLPFGGVGASGFGRYHGKFSFDTFSHQKAVQWTSQGMEMLNAPRYPPLTPSKLKLLDSLMFRSSP